MSLYWDYQDLEEQKEKKLNEWLQDNPIDHGLEQLKREAEEKRKAVARKNARESAEKEKQKIRAEITELDKKLKN